MNGSIFLLAALEIGDSGVAIWQDMGNAIALWPARQPSANPNEALGHVIT